MSNQVLDRVEFIDLLKVVVAIYVEDSHITFNSETAIVFSIILFAFKVNSFHLKPWQGHSIISDPFLIVQTFVFLPQLSSAFIIFYHLFIKNH